LTNLQLTNLWPLLLLVGLALAPGSLAQSRPTRVTVTVESTARKAQCQAKALAAARKKAVLKHASEATRQALEKRLLESSESFIDGNYRLVESKKFDGGCSVTVDFRVDLRALARAERSLLTNKAPEVPIGVLIRYRIDGRLASQAGMNSGQATDELEAALATYGFELVSLAAAQQEFDHIASATETAFTSAGEYQPDVIQRGEGGIETSLLEDMRLYLEDAVELGPMRDCGGLVLFGELNAKHGELNPYGQGHQASASLLLQIHRLDNSQPVVLPRSETRQVIGQSPGVALDQARASVLAPVVRQIAEQIARTPAPRLSQCVDSKSSE
jgi:hypothetical protein